MSVKSFLDFISEDIKDIHLVHTGSEHHRSDDNGHSIHNHHYTAHDKFERPVADVKVMHRTSDNLGSVHIASRYKDHPDTMGARTFKSIRGHVKQMHPEIKGFMRRSTQKSPNLYPAPKRSK